MTYSWSEIRTRAARFAQEWKGASYERGEAQTFYNELFDVFGIPRRRVAVFEERVKQLGARNPGFIDLFWKGTLLVEQKSAGRDLVQARKQAFDYLSGLKNDELPRYLLLSDFQYFELLDLATGKETRFPLEEFPKFVEEFGFMVGVIPPRARSAVPANITASERMGALHDALQTGGFSGHDLERFLVRLVFCLFADDTGIFQRGIFQDFVEATSRASDLGPRLSQLFDVLNTPIGARQKHLSEELKAFPYINGDLFAERLSLPAFDESMWELLIGAGNFHWEEISPAIFGALFQSVMDRRKRRQIGAHYTSEESILKVLGPLCLDRLHDELGKIKSLKGPALLSALQNYQTLLSKLRFLDPACGCGNFLVIAYRELRALELEVIKLLRAHGALTAGVSPSKVNVDQFFGIEILEFPVRIAEVAMWMTDHIMNQRMSFVLGTHCERFPLSRSPNILHADALEVSWEGLLKPDDQTFVIGNPPYAGSKQQTPTQRKQVQSLAGLKGRKGSLDYVAAWLIKAARYIKGCSARISFLTVNSITQGEQVAELWPTLLSTYGLEIEFAHRPFAWNSEARGRAHVHVVVLGLCHEKDAPNSRRVFDYPDPLSTPTEIIVSAISPYLFDASKLSNPKLVVSDTRTVPSGMPRLVTGSKPIDNSHYILTETEKTLLELREPGAKAYIRPFVGSDEFIYGTQRWILALHDISPAQLRSLPEVKKRVDLVKQFRLSSRAPSTVKLASIPTRYHLNVIPKAPFLVIPEVSSEGREYVPIGWLAPPIIPSNLVKIALDAELWHFGLITSKIHMCWLRQIGGRLESRYRYSIGIVYNSFPWPRLNSKQKTRISILAQDVLAARSVHVSSTLADLYDPVSMPANLRSAHDRLDLAVDRLFRSTPFVGERERVEFLMSEYERRI